ncbi:hypothetical protein SprV_0501869200 [Sparganum proliferum]
MAMVFSVGLPRSSGGRFFQRDGFNISLPDRAGETMEVMQTKRSEVMRNLTDEARVNGDLVVGDYEDTYYNLSLKLFHTYQWASRFCRPHFTSQKRPPVFIFLDDDYAFNARRMKAELGTLTDAQIRRVTWGLLRKQSPTIRHLHSTRYEKWSVSKRELPRPYYPHLAPGCFNVIGADVLQEIALAMYFTLQFPLDDAWLGMVMTKLNLNFHSHPPKTIRSVRKKKRKKKKKKKKKEKKKKKMMMVRNDVAPFRPIVRLKGTPKYGLAKWLFRRLKLLTAESDTTVSSSAQFLEKLKGDLAIETIELLLQSKYDEIENRLGHAQILHLLKFCLRTYFTFDETIHEQVKGTPMGSPISGFIAEAVLQRLESLVFQHHRPKFWARYVDDTFVVIDRDQVLTFKENLHAVFPDIQFTIEEEENNQRAFLDVPSISTLPVAILGTCSLSLDIGFRYPFPCVFVVDVVSCAYLGADFLAAFDLTHNGRLSSLYGQKTNLSQSEESRQCAVMHPDLLSPFRQPLSKYHGFTRTNFSTSARPNDDVHHIRRRCRLTPTHLSAPKGEFEHMIQVGIIGKSRLSSWVPRQSLITGTRVVPTRLRTA